MYRKSLTALCGTALLAFATGTSVADELEDVQAKLFELRQRAEQLADEGKTDAAAELRAHAQKIACKAGQAQAARARKMREREDKEDRRAKTDRLRGQILELRRAAEQLLEDGKKDRAEQMLARARDLEQAAERGEHVERRGRAQELIVRSREPRADLEQDQPRDRGAVRAEVGRLHEEMHLPREINQAIEQLREHGNTELAAALQRRALAMVGELPIRPEGGEPDRDVRRQPRDVERHLGATEALRKLRADVDKMRENPPTHPEIAHVIRDLRAKVKQLREELNELRESAARER